MLEPLRKFKTGTTKNFRTLFTYNTEGNGDTVEWCPLAPYQNYFTCGTYTNKPAPKPEAPIETHRKLRSGTILLFSVTRYQLKELSRVETSAILDIRWCPVLFHDTIALAAATGNGEVEIFKVMDDKLTFVTSIDLNEYRSENFLILSIDWPKFGDNDLICSSDANGYVTLIKLQHDTLTKMRQWKAHVVESWVAVFDPFNSNVVYSGGDDNRLNAWDLRVELPERTGKGEKHTAGVTTLGCHPSKRHCLVSGSYDESILLWDTRNWSAPAQEMHSGGGLWRLKWKPQEDSSHILTACIFAGFEIVNPFSGSCVARYKEHESLAYGSDWSHLDETKYFHRGQYLVAVCSFYDHKLSVCVWDENVVPCAGGMKFQKIT